jgi:hypothetical protein
MSYYGDSIPMYGDEKCLKARIDISKASQASGIEVGKDIEITIKGKVKSIRGPEHGERPSYTNGKEGKKEKYTYPGNVEIEISKFKVEGLGEFDGMLED